MLKTIKRTKNNKNNNNNSNSLYKQLARQASFLGVVKRQIIFQADQVFSSNGTANLAFQSGNIYLNLNTLSTASDFQSLNAAYRLMKINSLTIALVRSISESTLNTCFPSGIGAVHISYDADLTSTYLAPGNIIRQQSSLKAPLMTVSQITKTWKLPSMTIPFNDGTYYHYINPNCYFPTSSLIKLGGQFSVGCDSYGVAASTQPLFNFELRADCTFACPY